jgi:hypothetical protein
MVCHGQLAWHRPHTSHLTTYYLIMSFAGMLGGMFNTFVAPALFNDIYEYPLMIIAVLLLRPWTYLLNLKDALMQIIDPLLLLLIGISIYLSVENLVDYFDGIVISLSLLYARRLFFTAARHRLCRFDGYDHCVCYRGSSF